MPIRVNNTLNDSPASNVSFGDTSETSDIQVRFVTQNDERVRPSHAALHNTVWDADDPLRPVPPLDFGCRCEEEFFAKDKKAAKRTGLEVTPKNQPQAGVQALDDFFDTATQSAESVDPGGKVTPVDTFGKARGEAIEQGKVVIEDVFDEGGDLRPAAEVKDIANAKAKKASGPLVDKEMKEDAPPSTNPLNKAAVFAAIAAIAGFNVSTSTEQRIIKLARETLALKPSLKDEQALFDAILVLKPGSIASLFPAQQRKNARKLAKLIRRKHGPL